MTKSRMYAKLLELGMTRRKELMERLIALIDQKKVTSGCYMAYKSYSYEREVLLKEGEDWVKNSKIMCEVIYRQILQDWDNLEEFVKKQEAASMEDCQYAQIMREKEEK